MTTLARVVGERKGAVNSDSVVFEKHRLTFLKDDEKVRSEDLVCSGYYYDPQAWTQVPFEWVDRPASRFNKFIGRVAQREPEFISSPRTEIENMLEGSGYFLVSDAEKLDVHVDRYWRKDSKAPRIPEHWVGADQFQYADLDPGDVYVVRPEGCSWCGCGRHRIKPAEDPYQQHRRFMTITNKESSWRGGVIPNREPKPLVRYAQSQDPDEVCADAPSFACAKRS